MSLLHELRMALLWVNLSAQMKRSYVAFKQFILGPKDRSWLDRKNSHQRKAYRLIQICEIKTCDSTSQQQVSPNQWLRWQSRLAQHQKRKDNDFTGNRQALASHDPELFERHCKAGRCWLPCSPSSQMDAFREHHQSLQQSWWLDRDDRAEPALYFRQNELGYVENPLSSLEKMVM